jgi:hypothetical protein
MKYLVTVFFSLLMGSIYCQEISGTVIDSLNKQPIPFAAITSNFNNNAITNEEGKFKIYKDSSFTIEDSIFISSIGFASKAISCVDFKGGEITLSVEAIELESVEVRNREKLDVREIIENVKNSAATNFNFEYKSKKIFWRETIIGETKEIDLEIKKSSINEFDQLFMDSIVSTIPKKSNYYIEVLSEFKGNRNREKQRINVVKSARLLNKENQISLDLIENKIQPIVELRIKPDSYFKFKSGIFPIDIELNGVDLRKVDSTDVLSIEKKDEKKLEEKKEFNSTNRNFIKYMSSFIDLKTKKLNIHVFNKSKWYDFKLIELSYLGYEPVYVIDYFPNSSKAKYKGRLYIHADDFALIRYDYQSIKPLRDFSLFGISLKVQNRHGIRIFKRNLNNKYDLYFSENYYENSFGLDRPLKIIEKNKNVRGRRKQNELRMDILFSGSSSTKTEYIVLSNQELNQIDYNSFKEVQSDTPFELNEYDPNFWNGYNIIEPSQIVKDFKIEKN